MSRSQHILDGRTLRTKAAKLSCEWDTVTNFHRRTAQQDYSWPDWTIASPRIQNLVIQHPGRTQHEYVSLLPQSQPCITLNKIDWRRVVLVGPGQARPLQFVLVTRVWVGG